MFRLQRFIGARHEESLSHEFVRRKARDTRRNDGGTVNKFFNHQTLRRVPVLYQWYIVETGNDTLALIDITTTMLISYPKKMKSLQSSVTSHHQRQVSENCVLETTDCKRDPSESHNSLSFKDFIRWTCPFYHSVKKRDHF